MLTLCGVKLKRPPHFVDDRHCVRPVPQNESVAAITVTMIHYSSSTTSRITHSTHFSRLIGSNYSQPREHRGTAVLKPLAPAAQRIESIESRCYLFDLPRLSDEVVERPLRSSPLFPPLLEHHHPQVASRPTSSTKLAVQVRRSRVVVYTSAPPH